MLNSKPLKMNCIFLTYFIFICLLTESLAKPVPLEDGILLRQIADSYSAPLVASFLHSRIQDTASMIEKIKSSLENLNSNQRNLFTLKVKSLEALDKQLTGLQKTDYFNMNGTQRVKYLIEQYILNNEIFPTELRYEDAKFNSTPDDLLKQVNVVSNDQLIKDTNDLINNHLKDIEQKESNEKYNELQRLTASIIKRKLKPLVNFKYSVPVTTQENYDYYDHRGRRRFNNKITDNRAPEIEFVLQQFKTILDLFHPQLANLASQSSNIASMDLAIPKVKAQIEETENVKPSTTPATTTTTTTDPYDDDINGFE